MVETDIRSDPLATGKYAIDLASLASGFSDNQILVLDEDNLFRNPWMTIETVQRYFFN